MTPTRNPGSSTPPAFAGGVLASGKGGLWRAIGSPTLLAALVVLLAGGALIAFYRRYLVIEAKDRIAAEAVPYSQALTAALAHRVAILHGFTAFLATQAATREDKDQLARFGHELRRGTIGIRALERVHDGRIIQVTPLAGNEPALGFDLRSHSDAGVRRRLHYVETHDGVVVNGPLILRQGGTGLVLMRRFPLLDGTGYDEASIVLDLVPLLEEAGLGASAGVRTSLRDSAGMLLYGAAHLDMEDPVEVTVRLPDQVWRLQAVPAKGWAEAIRFRLFLFAAGVLLSGLLIVLVVYLVATRQAALVAAVDERTSSLRTAVDELHQAAASREETEAQLRQSQRLESLGRLAGGIAHDFNNLLTVIMGSISLARESVAPASEMGEDLHTAERAAQRASELTRKLLVFARRQTVEFQVVDLNHLLTELGSILRQLLGAQITVVDDLAPGLWPLHADPGQIEQIVTNLAVNARDAMPEGGALTIRTRNVELKSQPGVNDAPEPGEYVRLEVEDTGVGMSPEVMQRAFEPFFTTKDVGQGTGLGLATVYGLVRQAGGEVILRSEVGRGTRATIHLPRAGGEQLDREAAGVGEDAAGSGGETILLVEDEAPVRKITTRILGEAGYRVVAAEDGDSALRRLDPHQRIDLLVADVVTPGMGGRALAEKILQRDPATRVLFMSGYTADERLEELLARPGVAFIAKPFTARQLQRAVRQLLGALPKG